MKMIRKITKISLSTLFIWLIYSYQVLADLAPIDFQARNKLIPKLTQSPQIESVNFYEYTMAQLEWYHFIIIGIFLGVVISGGLVLIFKARRSRGKNDAESKLK